MNRNVLQLESRIADTHVAGTRVQASDEARQIATGIERAFEEVGRRTLVNQAAVALLRWKDTGRICNAKITVEIDADHIPVDKAQAIIQEAMNRIGKT